jgi:serine/threonine protein phosphatase 1
MSTPISKVSRSSPSTEFPPKPDILLLPENRLGKDIIVGDIHGSIEALMMVIASLEDHDRLIIVGDLTDRGPGSLEVVRTIIELNEARRRYGFPEIQVARGNHEEIFLEYYYKNSTHLFHEAIGGDWAATISPKERQMVAEYFSSLPYIIHIPGTDPFNVVHADMPISDQQLQDKIRTGNLTLTADEKLHSMWAREKVKTDVLGVGRDVTSIPTYCGHTIGEGVRSTSNHINLDVGAFSIGSVCLVEHQARKCHLLGHLGKKDLDLGQLKTAQDIQKEIEMHFVFTATIKRILKIGASTVENKAQKMDAAILELMSEYDRRGFSSTDVYLTTLKAALPSLTPEMQRSLNTYVLHHRYNPGEEQLKEVFIRGITDIVQNRVLSAPEKAKQIDAIVLRMAVQHQNTGRNVRDAYLKVLSEVSPLLPKYLKEELGSFLKTTPHKLSEPEHTRMFFGSHSSEDPLRYINKGLRLLNLDPISVKSRETKDYYTELKKVILQAYESLLPDPTLEDLEIRAKIARIEEAVSDPLTRYEQLATAWGSGWASYFHEIPGDSGTKAVEAIEDTIETYDNDLGKQRHKLA